ncbi:hypothetical protein GCM10009020_34100 [Natronoarchaeum mannanilyticum]|uniref:Uncharacterized protein n=1 Tax=Natronoarchaeum mannanilyticum TaxID=926360 RepID=A0AAV3TD94_9EURY
MQKHRSGDERNPAEHDEEISIVPCSHESKRDESGGESTGGSEYSGKHSYARACESDREYDRWRPESDCGADCDPERRHDERSEQSRVDEPQQTQSSGSGGNSRQQEIRVQTFEPNVRVLRTSPNHPDKRSTDKETYHAIWKWLSGDEVAAQ